MQLGFFYNKGRLFQYLATLAGAFSIISSGINLGWTSPYLPKLTSNSSHIPTTNDEGSWCAVAPLLGAPPGAIIAAILADKIGRKFTTLLMAPVVFFSCIGIAFAESIWVITGLRFIIGAAEGALYTALPMYVGEISDPSIRGFLTSTIALAGISGTLMINIVGSMTDIFTSSLICSFVPLIHFTAFICMPESPYYYIKKHNYRDAKTSLQVLRGTNNIDEEMEALCKAVSRQENSKKASFLDLFTESSNRKACYIFVIICMTNKFSGKNPCLFYTETIFQEAGTTIDPSISVIIYSTVELLAVGATTFFIVDRFGKRWLLITSTLGCSIAVFSLAMHFYLKEIIHGFAETFFWLPITALVCYNILFSIGLAFGPVTMLSELFPTTVKAKALCLADTFSVLMGTLCSKFFQFTINQFGNMYVPFFCFSVCTMTGLIFIIKFVPETKGKTLEEIQYMLIGQSDTSKRTDNNEIEMQ
ncbi:facilitated trehalose transporter Tret1-like [Aethina tumida]|uniref:facilitated trehalose transporter Tret1-like n=1 Tax=Aethina tumida TaxID=116153 RepID=UPI00096B27F5|nr:facilitated trehalose transporter Tret1-like [Aethina tumida]